VRYEQLQAPESTHSKVQKHTHYVHREQWSRARREGPQMARSTHVKMQKQTH